MARIEIEVQGLDTLRQYFTTRPDAVRREIATAIHRSALLVQRNARIEAPVDTGLLRSSIGLSLTPTSATVSTRKKYAIWVHEGTGKYARNGRGRKTPWFVKSPKGTMTNKNGQFGFWTHGQKPNPFMERAAEQSERGIQDAFDKAVQNVVEGA